MRPPRRALLAGAPLGVIALGASACTDDRSSGGGTGPSADLPTAAAFTDEGVRGSMSALPELTAPADLRTVRLADGLVPPTNRWFSGLVFGDEPQTVHPLPLSFALVDGGFALGLPTVTTSARTIMGAHVPEVEVAVAGAGSGIVSAYDEASVRLDLLGGDGTALASVTIAEGWPCVAVQARTALDLTLSASFTGAATAAEPATLTVGTHEYGLRLEGGELDGARCSLEADGWVTLFAVPAGGIAADVAPAAVPLRGTTLTRSVSDDAARATLTYETAGSSPTVVAAMPHHGADAQAAEVLGTYPSVYGTLVLRPGPDLTWSAPRRTVRAALDLSGLDDDAREELAAQVVADAAGLPDYPADTYFGGKALHRDAQLLAIARQVGADEAAAGLEERVLAQIRRWTEVAGAEERDAFCFTYDATNRGVVGLTPSFGSEQFNDHHFHYGYFLHAAGTLAADDEDLAAELAPVMDALAADIACDAATDAVPVRRVFDAYASHSWASGTSPFADGNNQESSSEATTAWAGLELWARARGDEELAAGAAWLLAHEAAAARAYWTDFDLADPVYEGFEHSVLPLQFGGKRDYATWFSPEPAAALAILALPMSPSSDHLADDPERVRRNIAEATASGGFAQQYGDWLLMYAALGGEDDRAAALEAARELADEHLDDGDTRSYLLAFILSR